MNQQELTFEQAYRELETTVKRLEHETLPLAEMIALYQRGVDLANYCDQQLDTAVLSVKVLTSSVQLSDRP